jgi:hypothetical protein
MNCTDAEENGVAVMRVSPPEKRRLVMTAKAATAKARMDDALVDRLREELGVRGVLVQMAKRRQIIELRCEMPSCYCHKGRAHFDPKSHPPGPWEPSPDHYPRLKSDGGHLDPWNVRLSHVLCNREDYDWRMRIRRMLEKEMSLDEIAENLNHKGVRAPHGRGKWSAATVRKAFVS